MQHSSAEKLSTVRLRRCSVPLPVCLGPGQLKPLTMPAELARVANTALRSAVRTTPTACRQLPSASLVSSLRVLSISAPQIQKRYQSWTSPSRAGNRNRNIDVNITKPKGPQASGGASVSRSGSLIDKIDLGESGTGPRNVFDSAADDIDYSSGVTFELGSLDKNNKSYLKNREAMTANYPEIRCVPRTGRTVFVSRGADVVRSFKVLERQCIANRVRSDSFTQRFHERPGLKRKRLKRENWRKKFMSSFRATCKRVENLRRQGW